MKNKKKMCFGVIIGTRAYFNSELAKDVRKQLLETLTKGRAMTMSFSPKTLRRQAVAVLKQEKMA